jgi:hypothetical protein
VVAKRQTEERAGDREHPQAPSIDLSAEREAGEETHSSPGTIEPSAELHRYFLDQPAQLTEDQVYDLETRFIEEEGVIRRTALASLTRSGRDMHSSCTRSDEVARSFAQMSSHIEHYVARLEAFIKLMNTANARLQLALYGRPDRERLLRDAKNTKLN